MSDERKRSAKMRHLRDSLRQTLGVLLVILLAFFGRPVGAWFWLGAALAVAGIATRLWASGYVKKNEELATGGPYAWVRHPLYVGNLLLAIGFAIAANRWWGYLVTAAFLAFFYPYAIRDEDAKLRRLFGSSWEAWRAETRALLPGLRPYAGREAGRWSVAYSLRLNGEPWIALFLLACLVVLYSRG